MIILILSHNVPAKEYDPIINIAVENCKNVKQPNIENAKIIAKKLYDVEQKFDVPKKLKGMILAAACLESGFNPGARGDRKFSKSKKKPMAIGVLQMWPIYEKMYPGIDRTNPRQAAEAWMSHIVKQIPKVKKRCKYKTPKKIWVAAWVTGIRYKKPGGRCKERPKHLRFLKKMHRIYNDKLNPAL